MRELRCEGAWCELLTEQARLQNWDELVEGRCLCAEACARSDRRRRPPSSLLAVRAAVDGGSWEQARMRLGAVRAPATEGSC